MSSSPSSLRDLYIEELQDLWSANDQMKDVVDTMADAVSDSRLSSRFRESASGIEKHMTLIEALLDNLGEKTNKEHCRGMQGLVKEARKHGVDVKNSGAVRDVAIIAQYQRMCHYGLAGFGTAKAYAEALKVLPDHLQPVTVCVHFHDIRKKRHQAFLKHGFNVVTAGDPLDACYPDRFYDLLRSHAYSTGNGVATATFYSVDLGIPFFLFGPEAHLVNASDPNYAQGPIEKSPFTAHAESLFRYEDLDEIEISEQQRRFCREVLGLEGGLDWPSVNRLLRSAFVRWAMSLRPAKFAAREIRRKYFGK
jgi:ferritin-like metal-binding protein YciE